MELKRSFEGENASSLIDFKGRNVDIALMVKIVVKILTCKPNIFPI